MSEETKVDEALDFDIMYDCPCGCQNRVFTKQYCALCGKLIVDCKDDIARQLHPAASGKEDE